MQDKRIKLIYFSLGGSEVRQLSLSWQKLTGIASLGFVFLILFVSLFLHIFTDFFHSWQVTHLSKSNFQLEKLLTEMEKKVKTIESKVNVIQNTDDDLRVFVDLPIIDSDIKKLGVGGSVYDSYSSHSALDETTRIHAIKVKQIIDNIAQRVELASDSRQEIMKKYQDDIQQLKQTPSIRPVVGGRISAQFGMRLDPFVDKFKPHHGIDISAPRGTDIYAAADGKIIETKTRYRPNYGYGKQIIVDHGYGMKTRYAHLSKVLVKPGQKITRYTVIGKVGDTGRSTGPHLHYEVLKEGKTVNPALYLID